MAQSNLRRYPRQSWDERIQIRYTDVAGVDHVVHGSGIDISDGGVCFGTSEPLVPRTYLFFRAPESGTEGSGSVRFCRRIGVRYIVGVDCPGGVQRGRQRARWS